MAAAGLSSKIRDASSIVNQDVPLGFPNGMALRIQQQIHGTAATPMVQEDRGCISVPSRPVKLASLPGGPSFETVTRDVIVHLSPVEG